MKDLDFENLFTYMSLIFAICIFITILYGCVFANAMGGGGRTSGSSQILENFLSDDKSDIKTQLLAHLKDFQEEKEATSSEDKKKIEDIIGKINSNSVSIEDLDTLIKLLKGSKDKEADEDTEDSSSSTSKDSSSTSKDSSSTSKDSSSTSKDSSSSSTKSKDTFKNNDNTTDSKKGSGTVTAKPVK
jgi:hypothetical protein